MKAIFSFFVLAGLTLSAGAAEFPPFGPDQFCKSGCTEKMQSIVDDYLAGGERTDLKQGPVVASGECYHQNASLDPDHTHHGLAVLDASSGAPTYQGLFSFFAESDPWAGMNFAKAKEAAVNGGSNPTPAVESDFEHTVVYKTENARITYWIRTVPETSQILLLSQWAFAGEFPQLAYCRLHKHVGE